ncbi:MAG TPA: GntR family transcriptional regulator, partial [Thermodesulfobacteriota bacterium]|nr:GntR family transcriptional regulator [Thermodesulfobacteriota bacterium]
VGRSMKKFRARILENPMRALPDLPKGAGGGVPGGRSVARLRSSEKIEEVVDRIEIGILFGEYKPRERLVQDELAARCGVERNIVRAALKKLEEKSVIDHTPHRGCAVKEFSAKAAKDLYRLRFLLESTATGIAAGRMPKGDLKVLESLQGEMERSLDEGRLRDFILAHERFHQLIFESADNEYLVKMIRHLISASASIRYFAYSRYARKGAKDTLFREHRSLLALLKKRESRKAADLARVHLQSGINYYLSNFFPREERV